MTKRIAIVKNNIVVDILEMEDSAADLYLDESLTRVDLGIVTPVGLGKNEGHLDQTYSGRFIEIGYIYNPDSDGQKFSKP
jgi:hypothetical protein